MSLSLDLPEDLLENSESSLDHFLRIGSANENDSNTARHDGAELILDENTKTAIQLDLPPPPSSSLKPDPEENKEAVDAQPDHPSEPSEDMTIPDDTQNTKADLQSPPKPPAPPSSQPTPQDPLKPELDDKSSTPIMDRKKSFHILDDEDGSESCSTPKISIPLEFITPNKSQSSEFLSDRSLDESNTQECIFTAAQPTPERKKLAEILAKQAENIIDMRNLDGDSCGCEANSESNFDKDFSTKVNKVGEVTFTINSKDVESKPPKRRGRTKRRKIEDDSISNDEEKKEENGGNEDENEGGSDDISTESTKNPKSSLKRLRRIASILREEEEEDKKMEDKEKEVEKKNKYSLKSVLETLDFDTYKNSLFEYDDALSDKSSSGHLDLESLTGTESEGERSTQKTAESSIASRKHKRARNKKLEEQGGYSELEKGDKSVDGEEAGEPAPKRAKRGGLPCFRGLQFFLTRIPRETREAIQGAVASDSIIGTTEAAFEYVTCCSMSKRFKDPKTFLVAVQPIRTAKYILALALGVPCVSQEWITQSVEAEKLCDYREFLLPRGFSVLEKTLVPAKHALEETCPLDGYRIELLVQVHLNAI